MNILLLGSGGRENALAWKITQSEKCDKLFIAPGNAGTANVGTNVALKADDFDAVKEFVLQNNIEMVVVGPEDPLVKGVYDYFKTTPELTNIPVIGPSKEGARLEGSKAFAKAFMMRQNIPTAAYKEFTAKEYDEAVEFLKTLKAPYVLKADGLAAGKGVLIIDNLKEAEEELKAMLDGMFGEASSTVVIEEFLSGIECSVFVLTDGENYKILPVAKDYKRIGEGDTGLNTGGMGAYSPVPIITDEDLEFSLEHVMKPTAAAMVAEGCPFTGILYGGLMKTPQGPKVIEFNCRFGDPETEVVLPRLVTDIYDIFSAVADHTPMPQIEWKKEVTMGFVMASKGYPGDYQKGYEIKGLDNLPEGIRVFHMGTSCKDGKFFTSGGRVLMVVGFGDDLQEAHDKALAAVESIECDNLFYRRDIGWRVL